MSESSTDVKPYIGPEEDIAEISLLSVSLGIVLACILGAANVYLGLYAGMTVSASIPAAVVSMAILRGIFKRGTILENNMVQTIASTAESLAAGAIFTIPALVLVGAWQDFKFWPTTFIIMAGGMLGVIFMVPLRRALIVDRKDLTYPEGVACSKVLIVGQEGGSGIKYIGMGLALGALFKFLVSGIGAIRGTVDAAIARGSSIHYIGSDMSVALVSVGYIVKLRVAAQVITGGILGWVIALPLMGGYTGTDEAGESISAMDMVFVNYNSGIRYMGVGAMLVGGIYSIWNVRHGILGGLTALSGIQSNSEYTKRTENDMPLYTLGILLLITTLGTMALYQYLIGMIGAAIAALIMTLIASFLFVAVATYIVGLVGSSNSPVSGMTICALLMTAGVLMAIGITGDSAILATLGVAGVVCCAACTAGDIAQDLKTGQLVGATPRRQQWMEVIGVIIPAFIFAPVMSLLHRSYGIGDGLRAPQATMFADLTQGFFGDVALPIDMVQIGIAVGIGIIILDKVLERVNSPYRTHIMPVAVGFYLPLALSVPIFIGGLLYYAVSSRKKPGSEASDPGVLYGSGLIAGEALMGIGLAVPVALNYSLPDLGWASIFSLTAFALFLVSYYMVARNEA
ncbi:MAG: oligopeptide transporter, OPT family [Candidatus Hydrogenedentota bacterium]